MKNNRFITIRTLSRYKFGFFAAISLFMISLLLFSCTTQNSGTSTAAGTDVITPKIAVHPDLVTMQNSFRDVSNAVRPAVVVVTTVEITTQIVPQGRGWPWDFLFPDPDGLNGENGDEEDGTDAPDEQEYQNEGLGSGVIVRRDNEKLYVLTNNHVIGSADEIKVILQDDREFKAELIGKDSRKDLALLMFEPDDDSIPVARLGDSDNLSVGDWVLAVGNPFGYVSSVTAGIVSAKGRHGPEDNISDFIQTDASINQGNSGGALVNLSGEVVGINTWITTPTGGSIGLGFAIPVNNVKKAINDFIRLGEVEYGWLGVSIQDPYPLLAEEMQIADIKGGFIYNVYDDSPAGVGGLQCGDHVTAINSQRINSKDELIRVVGDLPPGKTALFDIIRFTKEMSITVKIGVRDDDSILRSKLGRLWPGLSVLPIDEIIRGELSLTDEINGVIIVRVEDSTKVHVAGLSEYDIITRINDTDINNIMDFYSVLNDKSIKEFTYHYFRDESQYTLKIAR